jgi:hypothetical protein
MAHAIGASVHSGWFAARGDSLIERTAVAADARIPFTRWLEVRGEAYDGKGVRGLGGGAIGQLFGVGGVPVRSRGAWGQVNVKPSSRVTIGAGTGLDDPDDRDLAAGARLKNVVTEGHLHWRPSGPLVFGVEFRRMETTYASGKLANDHLNLALGFEF